MSKPSIVVALGTLVAAVAHAQPAGCNLAGMPALVWSGREAQLSVAKLAAMAAPVLWFSPDEPLLDRHQGESIRIPEPFPGQTSPDRPVLYYQMEEVRTRGHAGADVITRDASGMAQSIDLSRVKTINVSYYAYFHSEEGIGSHPHDVEPAEFRLGVLTRDEAMDAGMTRVKSCPADLRLVLLVRATGKAHGLQFYWSVLESDRYIRMPMTMLIEEGKHAMATDKNGDGVFTPGYDVNRRVNDAWGVRDIVRTGTLYGGGFESWMAKVRRPEHRVFPPLPPDSPQRAEMDSMMVDRKYAIYELRTLPSVESAASDPALEHLLVDKSVKHWPQVVAAGNAEDVKKWIEEGTALKSVSFAGQYDGAWGIAWSFPFFIVHHLTNPLDGGYILHRMYLRGDGLDDFGWTLLSTRSASRWIDPYMAAGGEKLYSTDAITGDRTKKWDFVYEAGVKFRTNVQHAPKPVNLLAKLTPFWGTRFGIRNRGAFDVDRIRYVVEFGAGSF